MSQPQFQMRTHWFFALFNADIFRAHRQLHQENVIVGDLARMVGVHGKTQEAHFTRGGERRKRSRSGASGEPFYWAHEMFFPQPHEVECSGSTFLPQGN